jgi:hypothetical protein
LKRGGDIKTGLKKIAIAGTITGDGKLIIRYELTFTA